MLLIWFISLSLAKLTLEILVIDFYPEIFLFTPYLVHICYCIYFYRK